MNISYIYHMYFFFGGKGGTRVDRDDVEHNWQRPDSHGQIMALTPSNLSSRSLFARQRMVAIYICIYIYVYIYT